MTMPSVEGLEYCPKAGSITRADGSDACDDFRGRYSVVVEGIAIPAILVAYRLKMGEWPSSLVKIMPYDKDWSNIKWSNLMKQNGERLK